MSRNTLVNSYNSAHMAEIPHFGFLYLITYLDILCPKLGKYIYVNTPSVTSYL